MHECTHSRFVSINSAVQFCTLLVCFVCSLFVYFFNSNEKCRVISSMQHVAGNGDQVKVLIRSVTQSLSGNDAHLRLTSALLCLTSFSDVFLLASLHLCLFEGMCKRFSLFIICRSPVQISTGTI